MQATMAKYIQTNEDGIKIVSEEYLKCKGQTLNDYPEFIKVPDNKGNELAVHLLACMTYFKVIIITKTGYRSTVVDCDISSADIVLLYLGKSMFRDTVPIPTTPTLPIPVDVHDKVNKHEVDPKVDGNR